MTPNAANPRPPARILVVDDHPFFRHGIIHFLSQQPGLLCCGEADSAATTYEAVERNHPDLLLLDLRLHDDDGIELIKGLKARFPRLGILVISTSDEILYAERALHAGARGYVMKEAATEEVLAAIHDVLAGEIYVSRKVAVGVLNKFVSNGRSLRPLGLERLSDRELQVFQLIGAGRSTRQIADTLKLSPKTVETYRENIKHKLGLRDAPELIRSATAWLEGKPARSVPRKRGQ